ncbi:MAG: hypothetical protein M3068_08830 [Gemmatimonadota bacterium]|nr:hypothetical protein [Gemmatimonadota bacterium]
MANRAPAIVQRWRGGAGRWGTCLFFAVAALPVALTAQGSTSAVLLELPASARAQALGNAYVAAARDEAVIFYNPAQLATLSGSSAGAGVQRYLQSSTLATLSAAVRAGPGTVGLGVEALDFGSEAEVVPDPASNGESGVPTGARVSAGDYLATLGYAISAGRMRIGAAGKVIGERLAGESGHALTADVGAALSLPHDMEVAAAAQQLGGSLRLLGSSSPLPRLFRLGASAPIAARGPLTFLAVAMINWTRGGGGGADESGGIEAAYAAGGERSYFLRAGVTSRSSGGSLLSPLSVGGGLGKAHLQLDYAYQGSDGAGGVHRLGLRWRE